MKIPQTIYGSLFAILVFSPGIQAVGGSTPGTVVAWGKNDRGQATVPWGLSGVTAIAAGGSHTVVRKSDGTLAAWGYNFYGQSNVPADLSGVTAVAAGSYHTVALKSNGSLVGWGDNDYGQSTPPFWGPGEHATAISAGGYHTVALKYNDILQGWGWDRYGQATMYDASNVVAIEAGFQHTVVLQADGKVLAWGDNSQGQTTVPSDLSGVTAISASGTHTVALKNDGTVVAWGNNRYGQATVPAGLSGVTAIAAGANFTVAAKSDGTMVAWGDNSYGQTTIPVGLGRVAALEAGDSHVVALLGAPPDIIAQPASVIVEPGGIASFIVTATGSGGLTFQWQKDGVDLSGETRSSLNLYNVQPQNIGYYTCKVETSSFVTTSQPAALNINGVDFDLWHGLVAHYPFNGDTQDESGNGHHGILNGPALTTDRFGKIGKCFAFDGINDAIEIPNADEFEQNALTLSVWVNAATFAPGGKIRHDVISKDGFMRQWTLQLAYNGRVTGIAFTTSGQRQIYSETPLAKDTWYHLAFAWDGFSSSLYINGVPVSSVAAAGRLGGGGNPVVIGGTGHDFFEGFFQGKLDDVRIYRRALGAGEISKLYAAEVPKILTVVARTGGVINGGGPFMMGTTATLTVTPSPGYVLAGWTGDASGSSNPLRLVMDADKTVGAAFTPDLGDRDGDGLSNYEELIIDGTNPDVADSDGDGLSDAYELGIGRYTVVYGSLNWAQAKAAAISKAGTLAVITTEGEWSRLLQSIGADALMEVTGLWIGATDSVTEGNWTWITGEPVLFGDWAEGEPNNFNNSDFAAVAGDLGGEMGKWYDYRAVTTRDGYILESGYPTSPTDADSDDDGVNDGQEQAAGSNPFLADTDGDGLSDLEEISRTLTHPALADSDGDGTPDAADDQDDDELSNVAEIRLHGTNPILADTDGDGLNDGAEVTTKGSNYQVIHGSFTHQQAAEDAAAKRGRLAAFPDASHYARVIDRMRRATQGYLWLGLNYSGTDSTWAWSDGRTATYTRWLTGQPDGGAEENHVIIMEKLATWADAATGFTAAGYVLEHVGLNPLVADTDRDGLNDKAEIATHGTDPFYEDTDNDGLADGVEVNILGSDPKSTDTDGDGLGDRDEVVVHNTNPAAADTDRDGFDDLFEINTGFNPGLATSTPDAVSSIQTAVEFRFNAADGVSYRIEQSVDLRTWTTLETNIAGAGQVITRFYSTGNTPKRYLRVRRN